MKTVLFDVDTQLDFIYPAGALAVRGGAELAAGLQALTRFAAAHRHPLLSTADAHSENDPEFQQWPPHCVKGSLGQAKAGGTMLPGHVTMPNAKLPADKIRELAKAPQVVIEKQSTDCFTAVGLRPLLHAVGATRYLVYGVVAEICVAKALFGLLQTGRSVELISDATRAISEDDYRNVLAHFQAAGGRLTTIGEATASQID